MSLRTHTQVFDSPAARRNVPLPLEEIPGVTGKLVRLAAMAREFGSGRVAEEASALAERLIDGRFYVACIGQFKRGKSTLLNALVGSSVLPTGVVPITAVPTVLRYGERCRARVRFRGTDWAEVAPEQLLQYVSEEHNPENAKGVTAVEVFLPSALLAGGMCLVDTPGLGSIFAANTAATLAFVPHIDAALVVVGADPPIGGEELALVEEVGRRVQHLLVVLNKADRSTDAERRIALPFTRKVLEQRLGRPVDSIYEISAYARSHKKEAGWDWEAFVASLQALVDGSSRALVHAAGDRGLRRLSEELLAATHEERDAMIRPSEESERRISSIGQTISEAEQSLREFVHLFTAEQHRISDLFLGRRRQFLQETLPQARAEVQEDFSGIAARYGPKFRREAMHAAQQIAARRILPWLTKEQILAEDEYRRAAQRFINIGNSFLRKLGESKIPQLARMPNALDSENGFRVPSRFQFEDLIHVAEPASPLRYMADVFAAFFGVRSMIRRDALAFLDHLLEMNCTRVQSDLMERLDQSRVQLEAEIRKLLLLVKHIAASALDHARAARAEGAHAVEKRLARTETLEREICLLLQD